MESEKGVSNFDINIKTKLNLFSVPCYDFKHENIYFDLVRVLFSIKLQFSNSSTKMTSLKFEERKDYVIALSDTEFTWCL